MAPLRRRPVLSVVLGYQRSEPIQRAHDRADNVGCHLRVERGRIKLGMSEQNLDQTHLGFLLEQVRRKTMPQSVRRHPLLDLGHGGSGVNRAIELARGSIGSPPGNSQTAGRAMRYQSRSSSNSFGESIAKRSLRPLPCSIRSSRRSESTSDTFSATTSETRRPAL